MFSTIATCSPVIIAKLVETGPGCRTWFISIYFSNLIDCVTVTSYHFVPQIFFFVCLYIFLNWIHPFFLNAM